MGSLCSKQDSFDKLNLEEGSGKSNLRPASYMDNSFRINFKSREIAILQADLYLEQFDAIVHQQDRKYSQESNEFLFNLGGPKIRKELIEYKKKYGELKTGQCIHTHGGDLGCDFVIHVCMPIQKLRLDLEKETIFQAVQNTLKIANEELQLNSIGFCLFFNEFITVSELKVATIMLSAIRKYIENNPHSSVRHYSLMDTNQNIVSMMYRAMVAVFKDKYQFGDSLHSCALSEDLVNQIEEFANRTPSQVQKANEQQQNNQEKNQTSQNNQNKQQKVSF